VGLVGIDKREGEKMKYVNGVIIIKNVLESFVEYDQIPKGADQLVLRLLDDLKYDKKIQVRTLEHFKEIDEHLFEGVQKMNKEKELSSMDLESCSCGVVLDFSKLTPKYDKPKTKENIKSYYICPVCKNRIEAGWRKVLLND